jgi:hypothetical protein
MAFLDWDFACVGCKLSFAAHLVYVEETVCVWLNEVMLMDMLIGMTYVRSLCRRVDVQVVRELRR